MVSTKSQCGTTRSHSLDGRQRANENGGVGIASWGRDKQEGNHAHPATTETSEAQTLDPGCTAGTDRWSHNIRRIFPLHNGATITGSSVCQDPAQCYKTCTRCKALDSDTMACTDRGSHKIRTASSLHNDAAPTVGNTAWIRSMKNNSVSHVECHGFWVACDLMCLWMYRHSLTKEKSGGNEPHIGQPDANNLHMALWK
jgi:hypothetical protein